MVKNAGFTLPARGYWLGALFVNFNVRVIKAGVKSGIIGYGALVPFYPHARLE